MSEELMLDVGQANEFKLACRRACYTNADIKKMCEGNTLAKLLPAIRGLGEVVVTRHIIDCDADPCIPDGFDYRDWSVKEHRKGGQLEWDVDKVALWLSDDQKDDKNPKGNKLREELENEPVLNANVLDYLLAHPYIIPDEWKGKWVVFWGTIYCNSRGGLFVRCLNWNVHFWYSPHFWFGSEFYSHNPAAVLCR